MHIPLGMHFAASRRGRAVKFVTCEKCGVGYVYAVDRTVRAASFSILFLDNDGARRRANEKARTGLERALGNAVDPLACPDCGWYQVSMIEMAVSSQLVSIASILIIAIV